jgi:predicted transcriptional regulator
MMHDIRKITIVKISKPVRKQVNVDLQWFAGSLGLFSLRDKNSSCFRLFIELLKAAKRNHPMSSDELAVRLGLSRGTVVFHLDKLISAGLVIVRGGKYILKESNLELLIDELRRDTEQIFEGLKEMAKDIDEQIGFEKRTH